MARQMTLIRPLTPFALLGVWLVAAGAWAAVEPQQMLFVAYRYIGAGIEPDSFSGSERRVWRAGHHHLRLEEALDPGSGLRLLMIVNSDQLWMVNQANHIGRHARDPDRPFQVSLPVFAGVDAPELKDLQIGEGMAFFAARAPTALGRVVVGGVPCRGYELRIGTMRVQQYVRIDSDTPFQYTLSAPGQELSVRYEHYEAQLPFDRFLFLPPAKVKFETISGVPSELTDPEALER